MSTNRLHKPLSQPPVLGWLKQTGQLLKFFSLLKKRKLISENQSFKMFQSHFIHFWLQPKKMIWLGTNQLLVEVMFLFIEEGIIPSTKRLPSKIARHFIDRNGRSFTLNGLHQCMHRLKGKIPLRIAIEILRELNNNNGLAQA